MRECFPKKEWELATGDADLKRGAESALKEGVEPLLGYQGEKGAIPALPTRVEAEAFLSGKG